MPDPRTVSAGCNSNPITPSVSQSYTIMEPNLPITLQHLRTREDIQQHTWSVKLSEVFLHHLQDHVVQGMALMPGAAFIEVGLTGVEFLTKTRPAHVKDIEFHQPFLFSGQGVSQLYLEVTAQDEQWHRCHIFSGSTHEDAPSRAHTSHATFLISRKDTSPSLPTGTAPASYNVHTTTGEVISGHTFYEALRSNRNEYGPSFQSVDSLVTSDDRVASELRLPDSAPELPISLNPAMLDACIQTLGALKLEDNEVFFLHTIESLTIHASTTPTGKAAGRISTNGLALSGLLRGDVQLFSDTHDCLLDIRGISLSYIAEKAGTSSPLPREENQRQLAVGATFTAEPVEDTLQFWMRQLRTDYRVTFAPYNQIFQQLLDPTSLFATNTGGINTICVRLEDWMQASPPQKNTSATALTATFNSERPLYRLPNNLQIAQINPYETDYLYQEIFVDRTYLKHQIQIRPGDCVIDVGANIGMFTLFVLQQAPDARIFAVEPSPAVYEALSQNASMYGTNVTPLNVGLADHDGEATFTFYENSSVFSSFHADEALDREAIQTVVENVIVQHDTSSTLDESTTLLAEELMEYRLNKQSISCPLRSLSSLIEEHEIDTIDLLKIDVEKSELQVLNGIDDAHWSRIRQIVIEVHDTEGPVIQAVQDILTEKGFVLEIEEEDLLKNSGLYNIYGRRSLSTASNSNTEVATRHLQRNVDDFIEAIGNTPGHSPYIVAICPPSPDVVRNEPLSRRVAELEERLADQIGRRSHIHLIPSATLVNTYALEGYHDEESNTLGHVPYTSSFYAALGTQITRTIEAISRKPYKVVVLDCDNTLWQGVCGEDGPEGVRVSAPYRLLQEFMVKQLEAGMLLCLCSKNVASDVDAVFQQHSEMVLSQDHIVAQRINWSPKSENIQSLAEELQLGLDSFIFIDDNPVECAEVQAHCPEVLTLQIPTDPQRIPHFLHHIWAFDRLNTTTEDRKRTTLYRQNIQRQAFEKRSLTFASFIEGLHLNIDISSPSADHFARMAQLTQRTNQFNVTTRRRTEDSLHEILDRGELHGLIVHVTDRFGDYGLVGVILYGLQGKHLVVDSLMLSCRVLGKGVEHAMLARLGVLAQSNKCEDVHIPFIRTPKNQPALQFLEQVAGLYATKEPGTLMDPVTESDQAIDVLFTVPASAAASCTFSLQRTISEAVFSPSASATTPATLREDVHQLQHIAATYHDIHSILEAVKADKTHKKASSPLPFVAPGSTLEREISAIWCDILGLSQVGIDDNFFDVGGSSLRAVQVVARLRQELKADLSLVHLFEKPTVRSLAQLLGGDSSTSAKETTHAGKKRGEMRRNRRTARGRKPTK